MTCCGNGRWCFYSGRPVNRQCLQCHEWSGCNKQTSLCEVCYHREATWLCPCSRQYWAGWNTASAPTPTLPVLGVASDSLTGSGGGTGGISAPGSGTTGSGGGFTPGSGSTGSGATNSGGSGATGSGNTTTSSGDGAFGAAPTVPPGLGLEALTQRLDRLEQKVDTILQSIHVLASTLATIVNTLQQAQ